MKSWVFDIHGGGHWHSRADFVSYRWVNRCKSVATWVRSVLKKLQILTAVKRSSSASDVAPESIRYGWCGWLRHVARWGTGTFDEDGSYQSDSGGYGDGGDGGGGE